VIARPMPLPAPVTSAARACGSLMSGFSDIGYDAPRS
jgi:hypothetical protein